MLGHEASKPRGDPSHEVLQAKDASGHNALKVTTCSRPRSALGH